MRFLLLLLVACAVAGFVLPGRQEHADNPCAALQIRVRGLAETQFAKLSQPTDPNARDAMAQAKERILGTLDVERLARERFPVLPPEVACAVAYWTTVYQPDLRLLLPGLGHNPPRASG